MLEIERDSVQAVLFVFSSTFPPTSMFPRSLLLRSFLIAEIKKKKNEKKAHATQHFSSIIILILSTTADWCLQRGGEKTEIANDGEEEEKVCACEVSSEVKDRSFEMKLPFFAPFRSSLPMFQFFPPFSFRFSLRILHSGGTRPPPPFAISTKSRRRSCWARASRRWRCPRRCRRRLGATGR